MKELDELIDRAKGTKWQNELIEVAEAVDKRIEFYLKKGHVEKAYHFTEMIRMLIEGYRETLNRLEKEIFESEQDFQATRH